MFLRCSSALRRRLTVPFLMLVLLSGCGQVPSAQQLHKTITPSPSEASALGTSIAFDLGRWIHIQSQSGFTCGPDPIPLIPGALVLSTVQPTYDQGTLQSMKTYVAAAAQTYVALVIMARMATLRLFPILHFLPVPMLFN
jgi:uncharacterized protein YceK